MPVNCKRILESCRLCQGNPGLISFIDNKDFILQVFECTKIKINDKETDLFPKKVCSSCKLNIEEFFVFIQKIRFVNKQLSAQFSSNGNKTTGNLLQCNDCSACLSNKTLLKKHTKLHRNCERFKCTQCPKTYAHFKNLQVHQKIHPNIYCINCSVTFDSLDARIQHNCALKLEDVKGNIAHSTSCNEDTSAAICLSEPFVIKTEAVEERVETEFSTKLEKSEDLQKETENNNYSEVENGFNNFDINKDTTKFENYLDQSIVYKKTLPKPKGNYVCQLCHQEFTLKSNLRVHEKTNHETFPCTYENCNKICTSSYTFRTHLMKHEGKLPYLCVTCGKGFITKNSLTCHEKIHAKIKPYTCKECEISFSVASNLRAHQKKHHEGVRFYCSQCTRAFITKCSLERHELLHTGIKEFKCDSCSAAFYTNKELLKHQRYHQGLRLYKCDRCFKTFFEKHHLTIHIRVHTGERPYVCKIDGCGKSFTESQKLSRHAKARHPSVSFRTYESKD